MGPLEFPAWDPVLIDFPGPIDLRVYGLMYVVGFLAGRFVFRRLARSGFLPIRVDQVDDLIFYAVIGVILGGRTGYALFYDQELLNPLRFLQVWTGGLSFHGGLLGVLAALVWFARKHRISAGRVMDSAALAVTPGILAVRIANFVNGELYGRVTAADTPFAMQFPTDPIAIRELGLGGLMTRDRELLTMYAVRKPGYEWEAVRPSLSETDAAGRPMDWESLQPLLDWERVRKLVPYRHPSQLYEAAGEGLLVGLVLLAVYLATRKRPLAPWTYGGIFGLGYGAVRFGIEYLRKPDAQFYAEGGDGTVLFGMTMGQTLCMAMIVSCSALIARGLILPRGPEPVPVPEPEPEPQEAIS